MRPRPTIRLRLTLWYAGVFFLGGALLLGAGYALVRENVETDRVEVRRALEDELGRPLVVPAPGTMDQPVPPGVEPRLPDDVLRAPAPRTLPAPRPEELTAAQQAVNEDALDRIFAGFAAALALTTLLALGSGWLAAGRALQPIAEITAAARRMSQDRLHERLALDGPRDELRELADTLDAMLARLDEAFQAQRRFVSNASHELRTPLAVARAAVDVALSDPDADAAELRAMGETVRDASERSERLIAGLLVLAQADAGVAGSEPVQLDELARGVAAELDEGAAANEVDLRLELQPAVVTANRALLERLVVNLVENSIRHNLPGGWALLETAAEGDAAFLRVSNSGPPLDAQEVEALFRPFERGADSRVRSTDGVGLGLSIVRAVARAHGGEATAAARSGGGLAVEVRLPLGVPRRAGGISETAESSVV